MSVFTGAGVALITPMHEDGSVNYEKLAQVIENQIANQTDSIIICGTTGEAATLSNEEHIDVIKFCVDQVKHRIPVIAGTGSNCTSSAIELSQEAQNVGADALLCVTPYYNKATQAGLVGHFKAVADSVKLPIILYNVPSRTGCNIKPETVAAICKEASNVVGIKEASGDLSQVAMLMSIMDGRIDLYSGNDDQIVPIMSLGGKGVISVLSNVAPRQAHEIAADYLAGDVKSACRKQLEAIELIKALFCEVNPIPVKHAMNLMGMEVGPLRMPLSPMDPKNLETLKNAMKNYGIL
ncbi:MAG: 4-hydroxy-tetrahydrodipicolinate synthase [Lachnospiraceae bacterium]|nr:4-hydroxy-tetrahydrodipicolinate synthase [Lachnospiraceae bacterium]